MEFTPDKNREDAIAELLGSRDYVLITATDLEENADGADSSYHIYYSDIMTTKGLVDYAAMMWENKISEM